jgi:hypothetical protein
VSQNERVAEYLLEYGEITAAWAATDCGVLACHSRIADLRRIYGLALPVIREWIEAAGVTMSYYVLTQADRALLVRQRSEQKGVLHDVP